MRHPQWQNDTPADEFDVEESLGDSLKDVHESLLRLSIDGEKSSVNGEVDSEELYEVAEGDPEIQNQVKRILSKIKRQLPEKEGANNTKRSDNTAHVTPKYPLLRRRRRLFVIALDCYSNKGDPEKKMLEVIKEVFKAIKSDTQMSRISGFALSTAMPISETLELLKLGKIQPTDFDALICSSGSEVYYPGTSQCMDADGKLRADPDYATHIEYRWGYDGVKRTLAKLMNSDYEQSVIEDLKSCNAHCLSFRIKDPSKVCNFAFMRKLGTYLVILVEMVIFLSENHVCFLQAKPVDELRQKLRMRGLRCHLMYCRNSTRLQVIPLLASRSQALR